MEGTQEETAVAEKGIDFNAYILDLSGEKIPLQQEQPQNSKPQAVEEVALAYLRLGRIAVNALQSLGKISPQTGRAENPLSEEEKIRRTELALSLVAGCPKGDYNTVELDAEETTIVLKAVHEDNDAPFVYYRVKELLGDLKGK